MPKRQIGALEGIPLAIKDLFCTKDVPTTAASRILDGFVPTYESSVTANIWKAGAVMIGKSNMDEFAMGSSNITSYFGPAQNPWSHVDHDNRVGSRRQLRWLRGLSEFAHARYRQLWELTLADLSRQPAAFCGVVGMKPTYGRCSRWGIVAFASSLDQAGPITRSVRDSAILLGVMAGHDPKDSTSVDVGSAGL